MRTVRNEVKKETDYFIFEQNIYLKKKLKKKTNNFLPFSLSSSLGGGKRSIFIRAKKTNPVKQSMHIITYMLL